MAKLVYGSYRHTLDEKNRVRIPAKIRDALNTTLFLVPGRTGCLYIVTEDEMPTFVSKFTSADPFEDSELNDMATAFMSAVDELKEDPQGRVLLKEGIKQIAGIEKEIVFVAKGTYVEVWPTAEYDRKFGALNPDRISQMLAALKNRGN